MIEAVSSLDVNWSKALGNALAPRLKHAERRRVQVMTLKFCAVLERVGEKQMPQLRDGRPNYLTAENLRPSGTFTVRQQSIPIQTPIPRSEKTKIRKLTVTGHRRRSGRGSVRIAG
jgi:hypothetical protein